MGETYSNGAWIVREGEGDAFVEAWTGSPAGPARCPAPGPHA
jgi:hypothetical protein